MRGCGIGIFGMCLLSCLCWDESERMSVFDEYVKDEMLTCLVLQGPAAILLDLVDTIIPYRAGEAALVRLQRRLRYNLDRRSSRNTADQTSRRQHVRPPPHSIHGAPQKPPTDMCITAPSSNPSA